MTDQRPFAVVDPAGVEQVEPIKLLAYPYDIAWNTATDDIIVAGNWHLWRFDTEFDEKLSLKQEDTTFNPTHYKTLTEIRKTASCTSLTRNLGR